MKNIRYINAGAGSGKTFTLTELLSDLIAKKETTPSRVILTTFTKNASEEFKTKAREKLISKGLHESASQMDAAMIGTVHSIAFSFVKKYWYLLGLGADAQMMEEDETTEYIAKTLSSVATAEDIRVFHHYTEHFDIKITKSTKLDYGFWNEDVNALVTNAETFGVGNLERSLDESLALLQRMFPGKDDTDEAFALQKDVIKRIFRIATEWHALYSRYKVENNLISFNDMEKHFLTLLSIPQVREDISESFDYVFVDEFQDSNPTQIRIFDILSDIVGKGSFWVGDPKQAIYDFRGCDTALVSAVTDIIERKAESKEEGFTFDKLPNSYRSDPYLVNLTNKAFTDVFEGILSKDKVVLNSARKDVLPPDVPKAMHWVPIPRPLPSGRGSTSKEVLNDAIARQVSEILRGEHKIKSIYDKEAEVLRAPKASDIAILCRSNTDCDGVNTALHKIGIRTTRSLSADCGHEEVSIILGVLNYIQGGTDLLDAELASLLAGSPVAQMIENGGADRSLSLFAKLDDLRSRLRGKPVSYIVSSVIAAFDMERMVYKWNNGEERMNVLESIKNLSASYEETCLKSQKAATLGGFISELSSSPIVVDSKVQEGGVNVMTYHGSKGLEWNIVILCNLDKDELSLTTFLKRNYIGVNHRRLSPPTPDNLYSEFMIRYIPRFTSSSSKLPDDVTAILTREKDFSSTKEDVRREISRLLYVGATRARDYLITASSKVDKLTWLDNVGLPPVKYGKKSPTGGNIKIWGPNAPDSFLESIDPDADVPTEKEFSRPVMKETEKKGSFSKKYLSPSQIEKGDKDSGVKIELVFPEKGTRSERITVSGKINSYSAFGTCIHNIFACHIPGEDSSAKAANQRNAERIVEGFDMKEILPHPEEIIRAEETLYSFLERKYGKAKNVFHEMPFTLKEENTGSIITGEIDLIWETDEGCVIVDFKNYPGFDNVTDPESEFYAGKYSPQMRSYCSAVKAAEKEVRDVLIFYSVQGKIVTMGW